MRKNAGRVRSFNRARIAALAGLSVISLAGIGAGIPAVMAGVRSVPPAPVPRGWPAAKAARMRAEDQLRQAAASRPLLPPPALPTASSAELRQQAAGPHPASATSNGQVSLTQGIVPLTAGGPFRPAQFLGTNLWNGPVGGRWEVVQAGGVPANRALGGSGPLRAGLFVYTRSPDPASAEQPKITGIRTPLPDPRGTFTVRKASGAWLTLSLSGSAKPFYFNVVTLRFAP